MSTHFCTSGPYGCRICNAAKYEQEDRGATTAPAWTPSIPMPDPLPLREGYYTVRSRDTFLAGRSNMNEPSTGDDALLAEIESALTNHRAMLQRMGDTDPPDDALAVKYHAAVRGGESACEWGFRALARVRTLTEERDAELYNAGCYLASLDDMTKQRNEAHRRATEALAEAATLGAQVARDHAPETVILMTDEYEGCRTCRDGLGRPERYPCAVRQRLGIGDSEEGG